MKKVVRWKFAAVLILAAIGITACGSYGKDGAGETERAEISSLEETSAEAVLVQEETERNPDAVIPVKIFYGDDHAELILSKEMFVTDIDQDELVRCLTEVGILEEGVTVLSLKRREEKNGIYLDVDFNQKFTEKLNRMGTSGERIYMGSVVNTFLTAFEADFMMVTSEGGMIESGHVIYDEYQGPYEEGAETAF